MHLGIHAWRRWALVVAVILAGVLAACGGSAATPQAQEADFVYGLTLVPSGIDPHIHASSELGIPLRSVYDTLVYREPSLLTFVPGLAESWDISEDGMLYTFTLRQDVTFHDGTPFNAQAVKLNLERVLSPESASQKAIFLLGPVTRVDVLDDYRVTIALSSPYPPLLDGLSQPYLGMASPAALTEYSAATYQFHQVGTGPYRFVEYLPGDRLVLERNPDYAWGPKLSANENKPTLERIVFRFYEDPAARGLALESGEAQVVGELLPTDARRLSEEGLISLSNVGVPGQPLQFMLNTTQSPTDRSSVREALLLATDRIAITQAVYGGFSPVAHGPLSSPTLDYDANLEGRFDNDPLQAQALLNSAEIVDNDGDGWRDIDGEPIVLQVVVPPWGLAPEVAQLLESQWETALQLKVEVRQVAEYTSLRAAADENTYNAIALNSFGLDPIVLNSFYLTSGFNNWSHVADPELDALLLQASVESDPARRGELYRQVQERIMDRVLMIPIREYVNLNGVAPEVRGLQFDTQGWFPYLGDVTLSEAP